MIKDKLLELYNRALFLISVPKCIRCDEPLDYGVKALCPKCLEEYREQKTRNCSRCAKLIPECTCSTFYMEKQRLRQIAKVFRYDASKPELPGNMLVYSLKHSNRRDSFDFAAGELSASILRAAPDIVDQPDKYIITHVPRRPEAIRENGYDHSRVLAKRIAKLLGIEFKSFLVSRSKRAQKDTHGDERRRNAVFAYRRSAAKQSLRDLRVIIVDDVITTGSSVSACSAMLKGMGARRFLIATLSIAYKDSYIKPQTSYYN